LIKIIKNENFDVDIFSHINEKERPVVLPNSRIREADSKERGVMKYTDLNDMMNKNNLAKLSDILDKFGVDLRV
jgi:hypothetical protein